MTSSKPETNGTHETKSAANGGPPSIPTWINEEHFIDVFREAYPTVTNVLKFDPQLTGGAGENYASIMLRVKAKLELEGPTNCLCCHGRSTKDVAYMIKTVPQGEQGAHMIAMMGLFPKETLMYSIYVPEFEELYRKVGKKVIFAPKFYKLKKNPNAEYVLLEDLSPRGFKNVNRLEGLDKEHTESVLRLLADFHAASAVRYETKGTYDKALLKGFFSEEQRPMLEGMFKSIEEIMIECFSKYNIPPKCMEKGKVFIENLIDVSIKSSNINPNEFNVLNHGDLWANNIMFRHDDAGRLLETIFVDLQVSRYGPPAADLYYFLLSSTSLDVKLSHFDYFIKYYHDHLVESLQLLRYSKKIPTLKDLRMQLLMHSDLGFSTATGILAPVLLDPTKDANIEGFLQKGEDAKKFKRKMYENPRYVKHMEAILPWMDTNGLLDF